MGLFCACPLRHPLLHLPRVSLCLSLAPSASRLFLPFATDIAGSFYAGDRCESTIAPPCKSMCLCTWAWIGRPRHQCPFFPSSPCDVAAARVGVPRYDNARSSRARSLQPQPSGSSFTRYSIRARKHLRGGTRRTYAQVRGLSKLIFCLRQIIYILYHYII